MADRALSADEVVREALELLDEVGLRGFTMRALADRLGTYPATIYWHVGSRAEVLSAVSDDVRRDAMSKLPEPDALPWDQWLAAMARAYRDAMKAHPTLAQVAVTHFDVEVTVPDQLERVVTVLDRAGFRDADLARAYNAFMGSLGGWVGMEMIPDDPEQGSSPSSATWRNTSILRTGRRRSGWQDAAPLAVKASTRRMSTGRSRFWRLPPSGARADSRRWPS